MFNVKRFTALINNINTDLPNIKWLEDLKFNENIEDFYELAKNDLFSEEWLLQSPV
jgi:guanosine-3',5'-bis(diphosphate) 3'-pyrophosphohydrolase